MRRGVLLMLGAGASFAMMSVCVALAHEADPQLHTAWVSVVRSLVNLLALLLMARGDLRLLVGDARPALWMRGVMGGLALLSYFAAVPRIGVGEASFLNQTSAVWVAALAPWVLGEVTRPLTWVAIVGAMCGAALLVRPEGGEAVGDALGLASGLFAGIAYIAIRRASASNPALTMVCWFTAVALVAGLLLALATGAPAPMEAASWPALVGAGVFATSGQVMMTEGYRSGPVAQMAAVAAVGPLMGTLAGWIFLDQVPDSLALGGMALLAASTIGLPLLAAVRGPDSRLAG